MNFDYEFASMMSKKGLSTVVILGHVNPDGDAMGCVMGLAHYIHDNYPEIHVLPYLADDLADSLKQVIDNDSVFAPFERPCLSGDYAAIVCDSASVNRIAGRDLYDAAVVTMVFDHHESNPGYGDATEIVFATSCSENIVHMLDERKLGVKSHHISATDYLYIGMIHDTKIFSNISGPSTMKVASVLLGAGVDHNKAVATFQTTTLSDFIKESRLAAEIECYADNHIACFCINKENAADQGLSWENVKNIGNKVISLRGVDIVLIMYEKEIGKWRISCRTDGITFIAKKYLQRFGGGGHDHAAGLNPLVTDNIEIVKQSIIDEMMVDISSSKVSLPKRT